MEVNAALRTLTEVCARFVGTLQDHETIQRALAAVKKAVEPKPETEADECSVDKE